MVVDAWSARSAKCAAPQPSNVTERVSEQVSRGICSETFSDMHSIVVAPHMSQFAHSTRRQPYGG
eukprot:7334811-Lingulodinium_polyedra.AAC.1